jgi:HAD superfamily hydrolase (TIGR01484 family)
LDGIFTDIDGTLTDKGKLGWPAYRALWRLQDAGLRVVPVTGRPAGWCDLIARQWPVDGVIGENGAFAYWLESGRLRRLPHPQAQAGNLDRVRDAILAAVPGARVASDQRFRIFDLAIDYNEDPPALGLPAARQIQAIFEAHGAVAKISDIHVNGWLGDYTKISMIQHFASERWGVDERTLRDRYVFAGDSPNDEPAFAFFSRSFAMAGIEKFGPLAHPPSAVMAEHGGLGFVACAEMLLAGRRGSGETVR